MPRSLITRLARTKAEEARDLIANDKDIADAYVMAADTIVAVGRRILVKPRFLEEALASLQLLSGRNHRVLTALCLITPDDRVRIKIVDTRVRFKRLSRRRSRLTSPHASGAARPAAMPSRASPDASCRSWSAPTPTWWACP
jgi:predicted house-cleaning NTP pyrophosphatase (Maf/HAM1 superfamily)